jgi:biotin transport system permease protein
VIGLYRPGSSLVHGAPAGAKLLTLALYLSARLTPADALAQVWPLRWGVLVLVPFQWWTAGWRAAVVVVGTMLVLVGAAGLVTLTTRTSTLLDLFERLLAPLRRWGVDPERVSLLLALTIRAVPVLVETLAEARDARRARGLERSARALLVPVVVRTMRQADRLGEALVARGVDD